MEAIKKTITYKNVCEQDLKDLNDMKNKLDDDGFLITSIITESHPDSLSRFIIVYEKPYQDF
ncbi:MAG: hypothetical protein WC389_00180 [Lutibacter sp.]|jgi:hypothetical protein